MTAAQPSSAAIGGAVRDFSDDLPETVDKARHSDLGSFLNGGSDSLDTLREHASDITQGVGKASAGVADAGRRARTAAADAAEQQPT